MNFVYSVKEIFIFLYQFVLEVPEGLMRMVQILIQR